MTKKDYELIANGLRIGKPSRNINPYPIEARGQEIINVYAYGKNNAWNNACKTLADFLATDNPKFNKNKFLKACGIED